MLPGYFAKLNTRLRGGGRARSSDGGESPLRAELFSADQMEQHGRVLAASHRLAAGRGADQLLARLAANESALVEVSRQLTVAITESQRMTPAAEWLLDNFHLVEEQIRTAKRHLPRGYSRELPRLAFGPSAGRPRVYDIALEAVAHGDGRVDSESLGRFVAAYQTVTALKLGELWAIPIMLRLAVIENLRRVGLRIAAGRAERSLANTWADRMMDTAARDPKTLILVIADMARSGPPLVSAFVAELARRLQGRGPALALPLTWIEQQLSESGLTIEQLVQSENQQQAADQVSISNSIGSLRVLGATDWRDFVESISTVEQALLTDPEGVYGRMDFATRDRYRHATEEIAKRYRLAETEVARKAVELAHAAAASDAGGAPPDARAGHVGHYLIDRGLPQLEAALAVRPSGFRALLRAAAQFPLLIYLGGIVLLSVIFSGGLVMLALAGAIPTRAFAVALPAIVALSLLAASQLAVALVNWLATLLMTPRALPRMDFSKGIPPNLRTLVVVPTMLTSAAGVEDLIEALEVRLLANRDEHLHFGLLTDFRDAQLESLPEDGPLLHLARTRIDELNEKYRAAAGGTAGDIFFLFHRPRRWNVHDRIWMGYERKRGKLADLNALLRAGVRADASARFSLVVGNTAALSDVQYVITLDTDTQLPRDAARQFVGAMAHPLNRPHYDEVKQRVTAGYGILQPRVAVSLRGANRSRHARLYGGEAGIDPYTRAVSDVYQDVFGEGSFIGKGIYEVNAFEQALRGRFPENRILSHDLLEGCCARSGLLSDVHLYEDYPMRYSADVSRRYRWIRGDWQLAAWLRRRVPVAGTGQPGGEGAVAGQNEDCSGQGNPLSPLSQWKLIDNLRRSLFPAALLLLFLLGWTLLASPWLWTLSLLAILLVPALCGLLLELFRRPAEVLLRQHLAAVAHSASRQFLQVAFEFACLPYEAFFSLDAIVRTLWRLLVTQQRLLEWNPSGNTVPVARTGVGSELAASFRSMWVAPAIACAAAIHLALSAPATLLIAGPILLLWFASPGLAWWVSRPLERRRAVLSVQQTLFLRALSRRTWAFFDNFVGEKDHWLPPDNYQEYRVAAVAHRTSPTNIGLSLLASLSAYDFGYLAAGQLIARTANTLRTMQGLERNRGHFYNWYDTLSLQPLPPRYISTVDSGNLAGHLLTLRVGLRALADDRIVSTQWFGGLGDTFRILVEAAGGSLAGPLAEFADELASVSAAPPGTLAAAHTCLQRLTDRAAELAAATGLDGVADAASANGAGSLAAAWAQALVRQCRAALDDLTFLAPCLLLPAAPGGLEASLAGFADFVAIPTLRGLAGRFETDLCARIACCRDAGTTTEQHNWLADLQRQISAGSARAGERMAAIELLALQAGELACMEYDFLFDRRRHLLTIGYNVDEHRADASHYDLLASEARLCSFVAIAQGQLPQESWFSLGRLLTSTSGEPVLLSWSGSMFEYLMPLLVMPTYDDTLLDQTCKAAVARQIEYGSQRGVPWGVSESGYNTVDVQLNYQYRAFGVPGLGLKRGLADDLVIAPYASALALMVAPEQACLNLQRLAAEGFIGSFGFYEAIDYTPARQRRGESSVVVRSFMAHHQGMSLLALAYLLLERPMQRRFESEPLFQAIMLLLQERIPKATALFSHTAQLASIHATSAAAQTPIRVFTSPDTPAPEVQLLSNGRYHVMLTNAGGGYSRWKDLAVTRWREDGTCDNWGSFCYVREVTGGSPGAFWSTAHQPTRKRPDSYEAIFSEGRVEFRRRDAVGDGAFETYTEIVVSPEDDIELRRVRITNRSRQRREIDVTSYADVVIAPAAAEALHPAFSNLFVQTEILRERRAILCTRRPRSIDEQAPWMLHLMAVHGTDVNETSFETDRLRFIGRTRTTAAPRAMVEVAALSGAEGSVLDPIVAIRARLFIDPEQSVTIDMVTGVSDTRDLAVSLVEKYQDRYLADRVFDLTWTHCQVVLRQLNASEADTQLYARLAGSVIHANPSLRADASVLIRNRRGQSGLWGYAISGDLPIVLLQVADAANIDLVRQLVQAHAFWRLKGLAVDLVIWNEDHAGYRQQLQDQVMGLISSGIGASLIDRPGGIFMRQAEQISSEDRILFQSVARAIIMDSRGTLAEQLEPRHHRLDERAARFRARRTARREPTWLRHSVGPARRPELILSNGLGGFTPDGREYVIALAPDQVTPAPWANVLANPHFGTVISESGAAYTWSDNAHEFRLTPWHNDPVCDSSGEALYLRDERSGHFWSPTPLPARAATHHVTRHGFGYSVFEASVEGICSELWVYVAIDAAVKFSVLKVRNDSGQPRSLSATGYVEWVLGDLPAKSAMHVITELDPGSGTLYARNPYSPEFAERVAFFDVDDPTRHVSGDRREFLGRNGTPQDPAAMQRRHLSGRVGAGLDPCGALQVHFELAAGEEREIVFRLGVGRNAQAAGSLMRRFRGALAARGALEAVWQHWNHTLGAVRVETPDPEVNVLANGWLVYQTLACRVWARSGYYQSGGAFGFRDQLQDVMALIHAQPGLLREHLLLCASRQFHEGDVQHWWHPPSGRGVRTHCSDDYLWLPLAVCRYVTSSGDSGVLDEPVHFLEGRAVNPEDDSYYDLPARSADAASLYEHCVRAIRRGLQFGEHGLPLMGGGDWNDGMNLVGIKGKGESVWLGFFLCEVLRQFAAVAALHDDPVFAESCHGEAVRLRDRIEQHGWDGGWYRRAWFDDGTALGSAGNSECRIDSISQSWSVLSGAGRGPDERARSRTAMQAVDERLVRREYGLVQLLDPPFDKSNLNPGYIRGYVPGVRENGGQYTHGAIWAAMALAELGENERAWELLRMINPINHSRSMEGAEIYKVEPYVVAADVYALGQHIGRGGWSWYTGSAGWMYRLIVESLLGLKLAADRLHLAPRLPADWPGCVLHYRHRETSYRIAVSQTPAGRAGSSARIRLLVDGVASDEQAIILVDDRRQHAVEVYVPAGA
ncbi:MAG: cyclic beta 1-2 glucan synthetase [Candidatus Accumulibacter sp.]|nr:cyclic beta 1-2 glucan synthetase [Accumulibacter sp.]